jgi:hypothetical protein
VEEKEAVGLVKICEWGGEGVERKRGGENRQ